MDNSDFERFFLYPGAIFVSKKPHFITTILGSCVAVCVWDSVNKTGGMNHFMLPLWNGQGLASPRYGNIAITKLIEKMITNGSLQKNIVFKVFGGGEVIENQSSQFDIGKRNIELAMKTLKDLGIRVLSSSTGGKKGRKIIFNTYTGEVMHKFVGV